MDQKLFLLINREWTSPWLDLCMAMLSSFDFWLPFLAVLIVLMLVFGGFRARAFVVTLAVIVGCMDGVVDNGLKHAVSRPRPTQAGVARSVDFQQVRPRFLAVGRPLVVLYPQRQPGRIAGRSFPSGHVMNNFAAALALAVFYGRRGWFFALFAAGVAYSRIYTGAHWPSDVLISIPMGLVLCGCGLAAAAIAWQKLGPRYAPEVFRNHPHLFPVKGGARP